MNVFRYLLSLNLFFCLASFAVGQVKLSKTEISERVTKLEEGEKDAELIAVWKQALEFKNNYNNSIEKTEKYKAELAEVEKKNASLSERNFEQNIAKPDATASLESVTKKVNEINADKDSAALETSNLNKLEQSRAARSGQIPGQIKEAKVKLESIQPVDKAGSAGDSLEKAKFQRDLAERDFYQQWIKELNQEKLLIEKGAEVLKVEKRIAEQKTVHYSELLDIWSDKLKKLEAKESASDKERVTKQIDKLANLPKLKVIAEQNLLLLERLEKIRENGELERSNNRLNSVNADYKILESNRDYAKQRIKQLEEAGLSVDRKTGQLLRQQSSDLISNKELVKDTKQVSGEFTQTQLALLELRNNLKALPANTEQFLKELQDDLQNENVSVDEARQVISEHDSLLKELIAVKTKISSNQKAHMEALKKTIITTKDYSKFINERLIWIASADVISVKDLALEWKGIREIATGGYITQWLEKLKLDIQRHPVLWGFALLIIVLLIAKYRTLKNKVCDFHKRARRRNCQSFKPTMKGASLELITALVFPLIFAFLSWRSLGMPVFAQSFLVAAVFSFLAGIVWSYSRSDGLIASNFKLNERQCKIIHSTMGWFLPTMLPLLMLFIALTQLPSAEPYGRILYIITMSFTMLAFVQLFRPKYQLLNSSNAECRVAKFIFVICMFVPTALIIGTCLGYYSSAIILRNQFIASVWLIVISMFVASLLKRWFLVSSRKIAIRQAIERREAMLKEREKDQEDDPDNKVVAKSEDEVKAEAVNVAGVKEQTSRLVKVALICSIVFGLWGIWEKSLPALSILDRQTLWTLSDDSAKSSESSSSGNPITDIVGAKKGESKGEANAEKLEEPKDDNRVTLQDLLFSFVIFILMYVAASNIPGLLEITVLNNLNIKSGAAFALTTTVRYLIVLFGIIWAFGNIGVTWSSIQWIAAAVTLGIGFGLQEVFANFVAGLILLYERPIRLGDVVTVGDVSGRVTKIKIRATTVHQFNNHELIVPNKEFITGQLVNWTLSDNIIRLEVNVGVAYGSDTELTKALLLKVAGEHPKVLSTPKPDVLFISFGASSLDFKVRAFVAGYDDLLPTQSDLHYQINKSFAEAGLEIAFPQQDLHIKTVTEAIPLQITPAKESVDQPNNEE